MHLDPCTPTPYQYTRPLLSFLPLPLPASSPASSAGVMAWEGSSWEASVTLCGTAATASISRLTLVAMASMSWSRAASPGRVSASTVDEGGGCCCCVGCCPSVPGVCCARLRATSLANWRWLLLPHSPSPGGPRLRHCLRAFVREQNGDNLTPLHQAVDCRCPSGPDTLCTSTDRPTDWLTD